MRTIEDYTPTVEIYSIDECFLDFTGFKDRTAHAKALRRANRLLPLMPIGDIWGIGRKTKGKLQGIGIGTAAHLRDMPLRQAGDLGTVVLKRTVLELQGEPCIAFDDVEPQRKGMAVTRSSGTPMKDVETLFMAITAHATRAAEKLRQHGLVAGTLTVFFHTNRHRQDWLQYAGSRSTRLTPMSSDTFDLVGAAKRCTLAAWPKIGAASYGFTKAGVMLDDLLPYEQRPLTLFDTQRKGSPTLMQALDEVNGRFGKKTMVLASEGMLRSWQLRADHHSPRYTTRLADLPVVR
jgi:DNA polymerase V